MAYVNVAEWKPEQVTEWLKGLDNAVLLYIHSFLNNEVSGQQLLNLRPDDLDHLGVHKLGHQEIILEAVEHLRNFHYELDRENLQLLALRVACRARSLHNELRHTTDTLVTTQTLADVAHIITAVKPLVCWLDGSPFSGHLDYQDRKSELLKLSLEMATVAHRDRFSEAPVRAIRDFSGTLAAKADSIIQDIVDPLILQPASLDLATLKKRAGDDLGILIVPSFHGVHQIAEIKYSSPAHSCGKIEEGDEVVQVNYQTVVGWQTKQVMALFEECPTDVFLTLKKRPRHTKVYGQIYMKPYRLPSKKRAAQYTRWHDNLPSPRPELLTIPDFEIPLPRAAPKPACPPSRPPLPPLPCGPPSESSEEEEDEEDGSAGGAGGQASPTSMRLYLPKPRVTVQRRATVTGASPTSKRPPVNIQQFWRELRQERQWKEGGSDGCGGGTGAAGDRGDGPQLYQLRDKSASFGNGFGLDTPPRPSTCLGIEKGGQGRGRGGNNKMEDIVESSPVRGGGEKVMSPRADELTSILRTQRANKDAEKADETTGAANGAAVSPTEVPAKKDVRFGATVYGASGIGDEANGNAADGEKKERGRLDKSHSTPAYDTSETESTEGSPVEKSFPPPKPKPKPPKPPKRAAKRSQDQPTAVAEKPKIALDEPLTSLILETINSALLERLRENAVDVSSSRMEVDERPTVTALPDCPRAAAAGLPDYHEIAGGDVMPDSDAWRRDRTSTAGLDPPAHGDGVQICVTPPEPPPRPGPGFDQSKPGSSNHGQSRSNFYNFDPAAVNAFNTSQSPANASSPSQSAAGSASSPPGQSVAVASSSAQPVPSTSGSIQSLSSTSSLQLKSISSSSVHSAMSGESRSAVPVEPGGKSSPPEAGGKSGVGYRAMQAALSLGRNKSVFSSATLPSPRSARKKNALLAKRRNISAADLGVCDLEGWLCHRRRGTPGTGGAATWRRAWFALKGATLYGYHGRGSARAHLMIALPGFTASPAQEVKSRRFAFKVYHTGTVFYFAGETEEELATWLDSISAATVSQDVSMTESVLFSESDDGSDLDTPSPSPSPKVRRFANLLGVHSASQQHVAAQPADAKSSDVPKKFGSLKKLGRKQTADGSLPPPLPPPLHDASSLDRKYLRIFGSGRHPQPVPTAQFRSYRRPPPPPVPPPPAAPATPQLYLSSESVFHDAEASESIKKSASFHDSPVVPVGPPSYETVVRDPSYEPRGGVSPPAKDPTYEPPLSPPPVDRPGHAGETTPELRSRGNEVPPSPASSDRNSRFRGSNTVTRISKPPPKKPDKPSNSRIKNLDYRERQIHASNPSLLMPSDMSDYRLAAERLREFGIRRNRQREDTSGFVTLEEFMLSRQEEERKQRGHMGGGANGNAGTSNGNAGTSNGNAGTSNGNGGTTPAQRKVNGNVARGKREEQQQEYRGGSTDKFWVDSLRGGRGKPLKTAQVSDVNSNQLPPRLKAAAAYQPPPALPGGDDPPLMKLAFEMHLDKSDAPHAPAHGKTSKFRNLFTSRSASQKHLLEAPAPAAVGGATSPGAAQKTLLGSPRLHRAIFRDKKAKNAGDSSSSSLSSPASPPFDWPTESFASQSDSGGAQSKPTMGVSMLGKKRTQPPSPSPSQSSPPPDYPGLEYPPVFEPETYTLTDASSLMRAKKIN